MAYLRNFSIEDSIILNQQNRFQMPLNEIQKMITEWNIKLGFETDNYVYKNKRGNNVFIFLKSLV